MVLLGAQFPPDVRADRLLQEPGMFRPRTAISAVNAIVKAYLWPGRAWGNFRRRTLIDDRFQRHCTIKFALGEFEWRKSYLRLFPQPMFITGCLFELSLCRMLALILILGVSSLIAPSLPSIGPCFPLAARRTPAFIRCSLLVYSNSINTEVPPSSYFVAVCYGSGVIGMLLAPFH